MCVPPYMGIEREKVREFEMKGERRRKYQDGLCTCVRACIGTDVPIWI